MCNSFHCSPGSLFKDVREAVQLIRKLTKRRYSCPEMWLERLWCARKLIRGSSREGAYPMRTDRTSACWFFPGHWRNPYRRSRSRFIPGAQKPAGERSVDNGEGQILLVIDFVFFARKSFGLIKINIFGCGSLFRRKGPKNLMVGFPRG